jgi:signal transduction histidine kinase
MKPFFRKRMSLALTLSLFVFLVMMATFIVTGSMTMLLSKLGFIDLSWEHPRNVGENSGNPVRFLVGLFGFCLILGQTLTAFLSKRTLQPIRRVIEATHKVAKGNFDVKVDIKGISELEALSKSFNKMTDELASIETMKRDFIDNFSHEFKTPIVSIRGFAKLLRQGELTREEEVEYLDIIISESERLAALSTQVLNLAKYETVEIIAEKSEYRLDEQIRKAILLLEPKWDEKDLQLQVNLEEVLFYGNEDFTHQIWINLIDNAIKFSHQGGALDISLEQAEERLKITIRDEGLGMDDHTKAHLFEKFYRADQSHQSPGNGIGLAIVDRLLKLMGGEILVESEIGIGTRIVVLLQK